MHYCTEKRSWATFINLSVILLIVVFLVLFYFATACFPMRADDYWYNFIIVREGNIGHFTENRISNYGELVRSMYCHRYVDQMNGRLGNCMCQLIQFISGGGKALFNYLNVAALIVAILSVQQYCFKRISKAGTALTLLTGVLLLPSMATVLWMSAACSYLWSVYFFVVFIKLQEAALERQPTTYGRMAYGFLISFIAGWWHETLGAVLCVATGILFLLRRGKCSAAYICNGISVLIGTLVSVSAPGILSRAATNKPISLRSTLSAILEEGVYNYTIPCLLLLIAAIAFKTNPFKTYKTSILPCLCMPFAGLSVTFAHGAAWGGGYFYPCLYLIILLLICLRPMEQKMNTALLMAIMLISVLIMSAYAYVSKGLDGTWREMYAAEDASSNGAVVYRTPHDSPFFLYTVGMAPMSPGYAMYPYCGRFYDRSSFFVLVNRNVAVRKDYSGMQWTAIPGNDAIACSRYKDMLILRFDERSYQPSDKSVCLEYKDGSERYLRTSFHEFRPLSEVGRLMTGEFRKETYSADYADGYYYYILPTAGTCTACRVCLFEHGNFKNIKNLRLSVMHHGTRQE